MTALFRCIAAIALVSLLYSCSKQTRFKLLTEKDTGIDFVNEITETDSFHIMSYEYIYNGAGVAVGDLNNDGLADLVFAGNQVSPRIYLNEGSFRFRDITANFQGIDNGQWYSGVTIADVNNDRWLDVYITSTKDKDSVKCRNRLWINGGLKDAMDPVFTEMAEQYGIAEEGQSVHSSFLDYDLDGDLDLYVMNNTVTERMNTSWRPKVLDGSAQNNDRLYRNNGNGTFTDVTIEAGIVYEGFGLGLAVGDVNKDGYPDIYVSNDYISNDLLYINQGNGTFRNEIARYLSYQTKSSMGNDMADVNNDGFPDIYTMDMMPENIEKIKQTINGFSYVMFQNDIKYNYEHQVLRNMLHVHNGMVNGKMIPYSEMGQFAGVFKTEWSWSPLFADYDNDGDKDLLIANGYPKDLTDKDWTRYKAEVYGYVADEQHVMNMAPAVKVPNLSFENTGNLKFERKNGKWLPDIPSYSYGAAFVDLDNDGDLDYVTNNIDDKAFIYRNTTREKAKSGNNYLQIKLNGKEGNTMALGAKVELWAGTQYQYAEHFLARGYASGVDPVVHFGVGEAIQIDSIRIAWPTGKTETVILALQANQRIEASETEARPIRQLFSLPTIEEMLFSQVYGALDYTHDQNEFVDFFFDGQHIIPHKFSQIGPVIASADLNGDGLADLLVGATNAAPTMAFANNGQGFQRINIQGLTTEKPFIESGFEIFDADGDGDLDIVAIAGGYENRNESEYRHFLYRNDNGYYTQVALPAPAFPASAVRILDYDRDNDLDIFIASRVKKGRFPFANPSCILINKNGLFTYDRDMQYDLGMVTDALVKDWNGDGFEDILVAREWNSVALLQNDQGKAFRIASLPGFEEHKGYWYGMTSGDFDNDGDADLILGNLGENNRFLISPKYPLQLYALDVDQSGSLDPVITGFWKNSNGILTEYPVNYLDEMRAQSPLFINRFPDYKGFSKASIAEILPDSLMKFLELKLTFNTASSYVIWNEEGTYRWERLPDAVQVAPLSRMIVHDVNGDGFPDVIAGGNDHSYDVATGYYDANKGLVMLSRGKQQGFDVLKPAQSGLLLHGMVQSLLLVEGNPALLVAGMNRSAAVVYELKGK